jgi:hypothetical protein
MDTSERVLRKTRDYRILIDQNGIGHIRIVRRINFRIFIILCKETYLALNRTPDTYPRIVIYIPRSLYESMSENICEFVTFGRSCTDTVFELQVIGE